MLPPELLYGLRLAAVTQEQQARFLTGQLLHWAAALAGTHLTLLYLHRPGTAGSAEFQRSHKKSIRPVRFLVWSSLYCTVRQDSVLY